jgi:uncharacterized membrane protein
LKPTKWLLTIILYTVVTLVFAYLAQSYSELVAFSGFFGFIFVAFVPGYCLISLIFPEGKLDVVETAVLSVALSFSIAGISGLFLGLSPIGITVTSITLTLSGIVFALAVLAFLKKSNILYLNLRKLSLRSPTQVNT